MQLFVNTRGSIIKKRGERFVVKSKDKTHEFSAHKLASIVVSTSVSITSDAIQLASQNKIPIVFVDSSGAPYSRVWLTRMGSTSKIRIAQLECSANASGVVFARDWIAQKLKNQIQFLQELKDRRPALVESLSLKLTQLDSCLRKIREYQLPRPDDGAESSGQENADAVASIRGYEGTAGRIYFNAIAELLPQKYRFRTRSRRPAQDPFNAMLNYSYGVLYSHVEHALILAGLDPFIGFFHANDYNQPSLVFDLIEAFRIIGERTTTLLFTGKRVKDDFFREVPGGIELGPIGRAALIESLNTRLEKTVRYPVQRNKSKSGFKPGPPKTRNIKLRDTIRHEAHQLANQLLGKSDIPSIVTTENVFAETT